MQLPMSIGPRKTAAFYGLMGWVGEAVIGLIPLIVYQAVHRFSKLPVTGICSPLTFDQANQTYAQCLPAMESSSQEVCILAVVISGLAVLSVVPIGSRQRQMTTWTRILILMAVLSLIFGSLFYALYSAHLDQNADTMTYIVLAVALISSLFLAIEGAILAA